MSATRSNRGFSMIELLVVVGIGLVVMAIAMPSLMTSYRSYQMGSALRDAANVLSRARFEAVRRNTTVRTIYFTDRNNNQQIAIDVNGDGIVNDDEPRIIVPPGITLVLPSNAFGFFFSVFSMGPGYQPFNMGVPDGSGPVQGPFVIAFSQRGTTTVWSRGRIVPIAVFFFQNTAGDWGAITVSPMGAVRIWRTTASSWIWH